MKVLPSIALAAGLIAGVPGVAQAGFFDDLFGSGSSPFSQPRAAPAPTFNWPRHARRPQPRPHRVAHAQPKHDTKVAAPVDKPVLQKTTGLLNDRTLRPGDAVMTRDGIRIFAGKDAPTHTVDQFVKLGKAHKLPKAGRGLLAQIDDAAHRDVGRERDPRAPVTGRSAATDAEMRDGPRGPIRYVGP